MEIHQEEMKILDLFSKNIFAEFTLKQIMEKLGKKSYNWTYKAISKLSKNVLVSEKKGNTTVIKLNLNNPCAITYLSFLDRQEAYKRDIFLTNELIENISKKTPYFILIITGSYATNYVKKDSDLDLVVIVDNENNKKEISPYIKDVTRLSGINVDMHIFTKNEFYLMLTNDKENFGKEVFRKHLLFYGAEAYYQIIKEAIKNGLQRKILVS